jgi:diguanylate cyclase (GGDEF)-like protein
MPPVFATFSLCLAAISALVIAAQYRGSRSRALLILASGYAFIALIAVPELFIALALSAGFQLAPSASNTLAFLAQAGFDVHVCYYIYASNRKLTVTSQEADYISAFVTLRLVLVAVIATTLAFGPWTIAPWFDIGGPVAFDGVALAATLTALLYLRADSSLSRWLAVALTASLLGELFAAAGGTRFALGWYVASTMRLIEYGVILGAFVTEVSTHSGELAALASIDPLTGLANRRQLDAYLERLFTDGRRATDTFSLLMIDIDHFKRFNDRCGHAAGDRALQEVAKGLRQTVSRNQDFAARYGGEEFVIVLTGIDRLGALDVAERLRTRVEGMLIAHENGAQRLTISIGIVSIHSRDALDPATILLEADRALYRAKALGRNRVHEHRAFPRRPTEDVATA